MGGREHPEAWLLAELVDRGPEALSPEMVEVRAHVASCPSCTEQLRAVRAAVEALARLRERDQDELSARRLEADVRAALGPEGRALPPTSVEDTSTTMPMSVVRDHRERLGGRERVVRATAVAAVAVVGLVGVAVAGGLIMRVREPIAGAPAEVQLPSGVRIQLGPNTEVDIHDESGAVTLRQGEVEVRTTEASAPQPPSKVQGPGFRVEADSRDYSVAFKAGQARVEPREGRVTVETPSGRTEVESGTEWSSPVETVSSPGDTSITVIDAPPAFEATLSSAQRAFYEQSDPEQAAHLAAKAHELANVRAQARRAERVWCDALIASGAYEQAVVTCALLLDDPNLERARIMHFTLGNLYRLHLGDCAAAIPHYREARNFPADSLYGTRALLYGAACAYQLGDVESARADVTVLRARSEVAPLEVVEHELSALEERLSRVPGASLR